MSYLFSMTEVAVESGSRSGSDEIHATLSKLDEERVVFRDVDSQALGVQHFRIVEVLTVLRAAHNSHTVTIW